MTSSDLEGTTRAAGSGERVDTTGWGVLFLAIGVVSLLPAMPNGSWLVAAGLVLLGASAVRASMHSRSTAPRWSPASSPWPPGSSRSPV